MGTGRKENAGGTGRTTVASKAETRRG